MKTGVLILLLSAVMLSCSGREAANCGKVPSGNRNSLIRIISVLPNPAGSDDFKESFTIKNFGEGAVSLNGWKVIHSGKALWELGTIGELLPCRQVTVFNLKTESLDNTRDYLKLIDQDNILIQTIEWKNMPEGIELSPE